MEGLIRRVRGALGLGLLWAAGGAALGGLIELVHNVWPNSIGALVDIWPAVLAFPGFAGGVAFSGLLWALGRRRRFDELSMARLALLGAGAGVVVSLVPAAVGVAGAAGGASLWYATLRLAGPFALAGALGAAATLALARAGDDRALLEEGREVADVGLSAEERHRLLGRGEG